MTRTKDQPGQHEFLVPSDVTKIALRQGRVVAKTILADQHVSARPDMAVVRLYLDDDLARFKQDYKILPRRDQQLLDAFTFAWTAAFYTSHEGARDAVPSM